MTACGEVGPAGPKGDQGLPGEPGQDGRGIESITLTSSEGNVDTYTITYSDGSTSTFTIANGTSSEEQTYNITFDLNGGQFLSDYDESNYVDILKGDCVNLPIPYRFGYTFEGWYTGKSINDIQFSNYTPLNGDTNLIAKWINDFYADEIRQQRSEYATDARRYFYGYFGEYIDVVPSEYIDTINYFVNELNFASDLDELEQLYNSFTIWLYEDLIVLDQMVDSIKNNLVDSWNNFLSEMSELSSSEYQQMYDDLLLEIENSENININKHDELNRRVTQFIMDVENYINNNSLDESRKKAYLEETNTYHNNFTIIFNNVIDPITSGNYYNNDFEFYAQQISNATNNEELSLYHDEMSLTYYYLINERFYADYDESQRTNIANNVAQNIYDYINNEYQS